MKKACNLFVISGLCLFSTCSSLGAPTEVTQPTLRQQIEIESQKLTRVTAKLELLEAELLQRRPEVTNLRLELKLLEEKMAKIRETLRAYQDRLEQFKLLTLDVEKIDQNVQRLRKQEAQFSEP